MLTNNKWIEPRNVGEARQFADEILTCMREIEGQLTSRNKTDQEGNRLTGTEYWQWRDRAKGAHRSYDKTYRRLKLWIKEHQNAERATGLTGTIDPSDVRALLFNLMQVTRRIAKAANYKPTDEEYGVLDMVQDYFQGEV